MSEPHLPDASALKCPRCGCYLMLNDAGWFCPLVGCGPPAVGAEAQPPAAVCDDCRAVMARANLDPARWRCPHSGEEGTEEDTADAAPFDAEDLRLGLVHALTVILTETDMVDDFVLTGVMEHCFTWEDGDHQACAVAIALLSIRPGLLKLRQALQG